MSSTRTTTETARLPVICTRSDSLPRFAPHLPTSSRSSSVSTRVPRPIRRCSPSSRVFRPVSSASKRFMLGAFAGLIISRVQLLSVLMVLQIPIELRAPSAAGGNDRVFTATVGYDSGCRRMSLRMADLARLVTPASLNAYPVIISNTAGGRVSVPRVPIEVRVLSRDKTGVLLLGLLFIAPVTRTFASLSFGNRWRTISLYVTSRVCSVSMWPTRRLSLLAVCRVDAPARELF